MKTISYFTLILIGLVLFISCEKDESNDVQQSPATTLDAKNQQFGWDYNYRLATTTEELSKLMDNPKVNIVRNRDDFDRFIKTEPILKSVFADQRLYKDVVGSMRFNRRGLQTYSYRAIKRAYPNRFRIIMVTIGKGFGMDLWLTTDYEDKYCSATATCSPNAGDVCIGANC